MVRVAPDARRAQNGQYLGLFQMGSYERQLFGHGETAHEQARRRAPVLRALGPRLEPVELPLGGVLTRDFIVAKCGLFVANCTRPRGFRFSPSFW